MAVCSSFIIWPIIIPPKKILLWQCLVEVGSKKRGFIITRFPPWTIVLSLGVPGIEWYTAKKNINQTKRKYIKTKIQFLTKISVSWQKFKFLLLTQTLIFWSYSFQGLECMHSNTIFINTLLSLQTKSWPWYYERTGSTPRKFDKFVPLASCMEIYKPSFLVSKWLGALENGFPQSLRGLGPLRGQWWACSYNFLGWTAAQRYPRDAGEKTRDGIESAKQRTQIHVRVQIPRTWTCINQSHEINLKNWWRLLFSLIRFNLFFPRALLFWDEKIHFMDILHFCVESLNVTQPYMI